MSHPELFLLRHGETEWNVEERLQGALDSPLTDRGRAQAAQQAEILQQAGVTAPVYTSPQGRALETARIVARRTGADLIVTDALREVSMGSWDGLLVREVAPANPPDAVLWKFGAPGGERLGDMKERLSDFLATLIEPSVLVTHGVTSRVLRASVLGLPDAEIAQIPGGQGVVFHLKDGAQEKLA